MEYKCRMIVLYTPCPGRFAFGHLSTLSNEDKVSYFLSFRTGITEYREIQCAKTFTIFAKNLNPKKLRTF